MNRLTYKTVGDCTHPQHYCHGPGIKKDDLLQRLGKLEDAIEKMTGIIRSESQYVTALRMVGEVIADLDREKRSKKQSTKCERFCNYHCSTTDCPSIQCDAADEMWGAGIADDMGLERIKCRDCLYADKRCTCEDCYFMGSEECPETGKEETKNA